MKGHDYIAVRRISNKADDTLADVGERCDKVPAEALPRLEGRGVIRYEPARPGRRRVTEETD